MIDERVIHYRPYSKVIGGVKRKRKGWERQRRKRRRSTRSRRSKTRTRTRLNRMGRTGEKRGEGVGFKIMFVICD